VERHLTWLSLLSRVSAFVAGVAGLSLVPLAVAALVLRATGDAPAVAAGVVGALFLGLGLLLLGYAAAVAATGRGLERRARWARTLGLALAVTNLFVPPFGTAFGAYALWVLLRVDVSQWDASGLPRTS
jgi:hypothetical protein